jgi:hypothetical protein
MVDIIKTIRLEKIARVYSWVVSDRRKFSAKRLSRTQRNIKIMFQCARGDKTIREIAKENKFVREPCSKDIRNNNQCFSSV